MDINQSYEIEEYTITTVNKVNNFKINTIDLVPFKSANIVCGLYIDDKFIGVQKLVMQNKDYEDWKDSDEYLISWIKNQLPLSSSN